MPTARAMRLVIDASVARAAGGDEAVHPLSTNCREFLKIVLRKHYLAVTCSELRTEWIKHASRFFSTWLVAMEQRGKLHRIVLDDSIDLHRKIEECDQSLNSRKAMLKDIHLIKAAIQTDRAVVSGDQTAHTLFAIATKEIEEVRSIVWIDAHDEYVIRCAQGGALRLRERTLEAHAATLR